MKSSAIVGFCTALFITVLASGAVGAINPILSYQGYLRDMNGAAYPDGSYQFTFTIYPDSTDGTPLWSEIQTINVADGLLHANLGTVEPLTQNVFNSAPLWLGVQLDGEPEFAPRHFIGSSVYAFVAANSEALGGHTPDYFADTTALQQAITAHDNDPQAHQNLELDAAQIASGTLDPARLPTLQVGSADVVNGSLQTEDLADSIITGDKIAAGAIHSEHLSFSAFTGANITDGSITAADLADSTITGDKIAPGSIDSTHLSGFAISGNEIADGTVTSADIANGTITGADIQLGAIGFNEIAPQSITDYHVANNSISGYKLKSNTVTGSEIEDQSLTGDDLASNTLVARNFANNQITASKIVDEPGLKEASATLLTSVGNTPTSWFGVNLNVPAPGYVIAFFNCYASLAANEIAQVSLSRNQDVFDERYVEARISSGSSSVGGNIPMFISHVFVITSAGPVAIYANVRSSASSAGPVDFASGAIEAIYIPTIY